MRPKDPTVPELAVEWKKGNFHPVYLFAGSDPLQKDEAVALLQKLILGADDSGLNLDKFDGETDTAGAVLNAVQTFSLLGGKRLVLLRRAEELSADEIDILAEGIASLQPGNCLALLWEGKLPARSPLGDAVRAKGVSLTFWTPFENQLPRWVQDRAKTLGKSVSPEAARQLIDLVGSDTNDLSRELEKLALYLGERKTVEPPDLETLRSEGRALQYMELDRAFWKRDTAQALTLLEILRGQGEEPVAVLAKLVWAYRRMFLAKTVLSENKNDWEAVWERLRVKSYSLQAEFREAMATHGWEELLGALETLLKAEWDLKTGRLDEESGLTLLVRKLMRDDPRRAGGRSPSAVSREV
jgi:DNA polymerase-3 subunit delta